MDDVITKDTTLVETLQALDREWQADIWPHEGETRPRSYYGVAADRIAELEAALRELLASGYERMGWHRTDKIVMDDAERVEDCQRALQAARAVLGS